MNFTCERQSLEVALGKVKVAWKDSTEESVQSRLLIEIGTNYLQLTASNGILTQSARSPLFDRATETTKFLVPGPKFNQVINSTDESSLSFKFENGVLEINAGRSYWRIAEDQRNIDQFKIGGTIEADKDNTDFILRDSLIKAMKVVENAFDANTEFRWMRGVRFTPKWIGASNGVNTIVHRWGQMFSKDFWLRGTEFNALKDMLTLSGVEKVTVKYLSGGTGATRIQFQMADDILVCNSMEFTTKEIQDYEEGLMSKTKVYELVFESDKQSLLNAIKQSNTFSASDFKLKLYKADKLLIMESADDNGNQARISVPVSFKTENAFESTVNWQVLKDAVSALSKEVVRFGSGRVANVGYLRFEEESTSIVCFEKKSKPKEEAKKAAPKTESKQKAEEKAAIEEATLAPA